MYQVLYRKYRPKVFSDVVGQDHITSTLSNEIETGKLSHAYLFTGSRGTGKTSCAKILSKAVNCLHPVNGNPCNECEICRGIDDGSILDVVEIDAASNNGVENIRDIREEINFTPSKCKFRVYIIDEVHMLSIGAFNALLKTLEEPPAHVKFILATTEVHKLPVTIISRCQRFDFRRVDFESMDRRIRYIAEKEGFSLTDEASSLIARLSDGGMRDALSLLDQCQSRSRDITAEVVCAVAGMAGKEHLFSLGDCFLSCDAAKALSLLNDLHNASFDLERLCVDLTAHFRNLMVVKTVRNYSSILLSTKQELELYKAQSEKFTLETILYIISLFQESLSKIKQGVNVRTEIEMAFIKLCTPSLNESTEGILRRLSEIEVKLKSGNFTAAPEKSKPEGEIKAPEEVSKREELPKEAAVSETEAEEERDEDIPWAEVLSELSKVNQPLWGILMNSSAVIRGDFVLIKCDNPTLSSFIRISGNAKSVKDSILRVTGKNYRLGLYKDPNKGDAKTEKKSSDPLEDLISKAKNMDINIQINQ